MTSVKIIALVNLKPEYAESLLPQFKKLVRASRTEAGNISYDLHRQTGQPECLVFVEEWQSPAALEAHNASAHFQAFMQAVAGKTDKLEIISAERVSI